MNVGKSAVDKCARLLRKERTGHGTNSLPISAEQHKIRALEREVQRLKREKEILK